ncbi:PREDICTED: astakine-like [Cyphomyrmex costatus]|uniref:Astakine n=1 Tax=Cyphomyrmex costatus TaxID=456900 RepID=A0A195CXL8_9HYME|nr:PREDICTED: astakine-like [Cyphomyrmex costatus]KYN05408.1 Astakine [Cyphomyrmex costatus]
MSPMSSIVILITSIVVFPNIDPVISSFPAFQICKTNTECNSNSCCLLKPSRYAIPTCMPFQQEGEQCRVNAETITTNLTYPDNSEMEVINISFILCPCADGLSCKNGICN